MEIHLVSLKQECNETELIGEVELFRMKYRKYKRMHRICTENSYRLFTWCYVLLVRPIPIALLVRHILTPFSV